LTPAKLNTMAAVVTDPTVATESLRAALAE
jgi:hypothetical protein